MRKLTVDASRDPVTSDVLFVLQVRTIKEPFLPKLKTFKCENADEGFIPFIPTLLSRTATSIDIEFTEDTPTLTVASIVTRLSILCPDLEYIILNDLPKDPAITEAVSEMLLACNRNALQCFYADSLLTEEARNVLFQLPKLCYLWVVIQGRTLLPPVALPNLYTIDVEFGDHLDWLQGFRGIMSGNLRNVYFTSDSEQIGDFLDEFKNVALTTSVPAVLQEFKFHTPHSWNPSYRSLLPFTQLRELLIEFSCENGCSSRLDDNIIFDLTRAMPELRILQLGGSPCRTGGRVTIRGLIALAGNCRLLSKLCIHFQTPSLVAMARFGVTISPDKTVVLRQDCALTDLEVGELPISGDNAAVLVTMALLQIFPRLYNIEFTGGRWENVLEFIRATRRLGSFIQVISKAYLSYVRSYSVTFCQTTTMVSGHQRNNVFPSFLDRTHIAEVTPGNPR